nr:hypothetical protein [Tanacetum cinerariifolium]
MHDLNTLMSLLSIAITWNYLTPTNNINRTSSNLRNRVGYNPPRQFTPPRVNAPARTLANPVGIMCYNCKGTRHYAKGSKEKCGAKDYEYHKLYKKEEAGIPLNIDECDFLAMTDSEDEEQELDELGIFMANIHSGCSKHMTRNLKLLINYVDKFLGSVNFENNHFAPILRYGNLQQGNVLITKLYKFLKAKKGGFCSFRIKWNFTKFLVDKEGWVIHRYGLSNSPLSIEDVISDHNCWARPEEMVRFMFWLRMLFWIITVRTKDMYTLRTVYESRLKGSARGAIAQGHRLTRAINIPPNNNYPPPDNTYTPPDHSYPPPTYYPPDYSPPPPEVSWYYPPPEGYTPPPPPDVWWYNPPPPAARPIAKSSSHATCNDKKYKLCYNLDHICPKSCPDVCIVDCVSCKPVCSNSTTPLPSPPPPPSQPIPPPPTTRKSAFSDQLFCDHLIFCLYYHRLVTNILVENSTFDGKCKRSVDAIDSQLGNQHKNWQYRLHVIYKKFPTHKEAPVDPPSSIELSDWVKLCDKFASEKFQILSEQNKKSRSFDLILPIVSKKDLYCE